MSDKQWTPLKTLLNKDLSSKLETLCVAQKCKQSIGERLVGQHPLTPPIMQNTAYTVDSIQRYQDICEKGDGYIYSRLKCPTNEEAAAVISSLEGGVGTLLYASGMSAITTCVMSLLKTGNHIVTCSPCYSGSFAFFNHHLNHYGIEVTFVNPFASSEGVQAYAKAIRGNTKMLYGETPINPNLNLLDLQEFAALGAKHNLITVVDSTFASPILQRPIAQYGIDIIIHSCTKYLNGHSDLTAGCLTFKSLDLWRNVSSFSELFGGCLSANSASLLLRGLKTLALRIERHCSNALEVAKFLEKHEKIKRVIYPGLPSHPQYPIAQRQMPNGGGGMIAFCVKGDYDACKLLVENLKLIHLAVSLGGTESLICHPATMIHGSLYMTDEDRVLTGISPDLIRFSVGLEDVNDLIIDLDHALTFVK